MSLRTALIPVVIALASFASGDEQVLDGGSWTAGGYEIEGGWRILAEDGRRFVELDEEFRTRRAPDLKLFLSPRPLAEVGDDNATEGSLLIAPLESHRGAQRYEIDEDVVLSDYLSILIHCQRFSKYWGGAGLASQE